MQAVTRSPQVITHPALIRVAQQHGLQVRTASTASSGGSGSMLAQTRINGDRRRERQRLAEHLDMYPPASMGRTYGSVVRAADWYQQNVGRHLSGAFNFGEGTGLYDAITDPRHRAALTAEPHRLSSAERCRVARQVGAADTEALVGSSDPHTRQAGGALSADFRGLGLYGLNVAQRALYGTGAPKV